MNAQLSLFMLIVANIMVFSKKDSIVDTNSAMGFCFIYGNWLIFALSPLFRAGLRAFSFINDKSAILCPAVTEVADMLSFKECNRSKINFCTLKLT